MSLIDTKKWMDESSDDPIVIGEKLESYFKDATATEIYHYLVMQGMHPYPNREAFIKLKENDCWEIMERLENKYKRLWNGPDIPIFIFPSNTSSRILLQAFNGMSGLAFSDKLFLFLSENNTTNEMKALFIHEYNHVCRLYNYEKKEKDYNLLDTIILEGLAENAVFEQLGKAYMARWTSYYSEQKLEQMWLKLVLPSIHLPNGNQRHHKILYGENNLPKMAGYCVGYYLVKKFKKENKRSSKDLLGISSAIIAQISEKPLEDYI